MTGREITQSCGEDNFGMSCRNDINANTFRNLENKMLGTVS
jgi:hypothetical protein